MASVASQTRSALAGPLLWDASSGMYRPSSGNNAGLVDVWGSALAVAVDAVPADRGAAVVQWLGAHWGEVVQAGQVRHLPQGQYWPDVSTWEYDTYENGGYWWTGTALVLPVLYRNNADLAVSILRQGIHTAQQQVSGPGGSGLREWVNHDWCCNCRGAAVWHSPCETPYPSTAIVRGVAGFGPSAAALYTTAHQLLGAHNHTITSTPRTLAPLPLHARVPPAALSTQMDPDLAWIRTYASMYQAEARECTGWVKP